MMALEVTLHKPPASWVGFGLERHTMCITTKVVGKEITQPLFPDTSTHP